MTKIVQIFVMHINLVKFLIKETPKQKTIAKIVIFLGKIAKQYYKVMLQEYKNFFLFLDDDYRKQKKEFDRTQEIKKSLQTALKMLQYIDKKMIQAGKSRQERKIFWRDFYKQGQVRNDVFNELAKEIK
jgi:hypothetical protein